MYHFRQVRLCSQNQACVNSEELTEHNETCHWCRPLSGTVHTRLRHHHDWINLLRHQTSQSTQTSDVTAQILIISCVTQLHVLEK